MITQFYALLNGLRMMWPMAVDRPARKRAREVFTTLQNGLPVPFEVSLSWVALEGFGETSFVESKDGKRKARVRLRSDLNEALAVETLVHEWAHMMAWRPYHPLCGDHGPDWGVWYSVAYRAFHGLT